jgi:hypothetical protein
MYCNMQVGAPPADGTPTLAEISTGYQYDLHFVRSPSMRIYTTLIMICLLAIVILAVDGTTKVAVAIAFPAS